MRHLHPEILANSESNLEFLTENFVEFYFTWKFTIEKMLVKIKVEFL